MAVLYQPFDGIGGATVDWNSTEQLGTPTGVYSSGSGSITFRAIDAIRGSASAFFTHPADGNTTQASFSLGASVTRMRAHMYMRVPDVLPENGFAAMMVNSSGRQLQVVFRADGTMRLDSWGAIVGSTSPAGTLPSAGQIVRVSIGVITNGDATCAVYRGDDLEPLWSTTAASGVTGDISEVAIGVPWTHSPDTAMQVMIDDFRVETGVAAPLLPPETSVTASDRRWVREPVGWRMLGQAYAREERWEPPAGLGATPPGAQTYQVPPDAVYVAPNGNDQTGSGSASAPYASIARAIQGAPSGRTIVLRGGSHRVGVAVPINGDGMSMDALWSGQTGNATNLTIQGYPGEAAWLDGSQQYGGWARSGAVWERAVILTSDRSPTGTQGADDSAAADWQYVNPDRPRAAWPERVWVDGVELTQVADRSSVTAGTFCVEGTYDAERKLMTSSRYVIGDDPTGREVRIADLATCLSSTGTGFILRGVGIRRYAGSVPHRGILKLRHSGARLENVTVESASTLAITLFEAHNAALRGVTIRHAGLLGLEGAESDDITIDGCLIEDCNAQGFNYSPEAGGVKLTHMRRPTIVRCGIHDIRGTGVWVDESVANCRIHSNDVHWCDDHGILVELSGGAQLVNNFVSAAGADCLRVFNVSGEVQVWNNTLTRPARISQHGACLSIVGDDRAPLASGSLGLDPRFGFPHPDGVDALTRDVVFRNNLLGPTPENSNGFLFNQDFKESGRRSSVAFGLAGSHNQHVRRPANKPDWPWVLSRSGTQDPEIVFDLETLAARGVGEGSSVTVGDYAADVNGLITEQTRDTRPNGAPLPADVAAVLGSAVGASNIIGAQTMARP